MFNEKSITIQLSTTNLVKLLVVALVLVSIGLATGSLLGTGLLTGGSMNVNGPKAMTERTSRIASADDQALFWFLEMDRIYRMDKAVPASIDVDDPEALASFLEMDRAFAPDQSGPAVIDTNDPAALQWFLEMDRAYGSGWSVPAKIDVEHANALRSFLEMDRAFDLP